jgi:hypothetical protein
LEKTRAAGVGDAREARSRADSEVMRAEAEARDALQTAEAETRAANLAKAKADDEARCVPHTGPHTTAFAW